MAAMGDFDPTRRDVLATAGLSASYLLTLGRPVAAMEKAERERKEESAKPAEEEEAPVSAPRT